MKIVIPSKFLALKKSDLIYAKFPFYHPILTNLENHFFYHLLLFIKCKFFFLSMKYYFPWMHKLESFSHLRECSYLFLEEITLMNLRFLLKVIIKKIVIFFQLYNLIYIVHYNSKYYQLFLNSKNLNSLHFNLKFIYFILISILLFLLFFHYFYHFFTIFSDYVFFVNVNFMRV